MDVVGRKITVNLKELH